MSLFSKKGQVAENFNWLFAILAGGIILIFFLFVLGQIKATSDAKLATTVLNNFDAILTGSQVTPNSLTILDSSKLLEFDVSCEDDGFSELKLTDSYSRIDLSNRIVYSPSLVMGTQLFIYVLPVERPFVLGNAILLTDASTLFLVYNPNQDEDLHMFYENLPDNISKEEVGMFQEQFKSYENIIVFSKTTAPVLSKNYDDIYGEEILRKKNSKWLQLFFDQGTKETREINYFSKTNKEEKYSLVAEKLKVPSNKFALFLAYSKDLSFYKCNFKKINSKIHIISLIYLKRVQQFIEEDLSSECKLKYLQAEQILKDMSLNTFTYQSEVTIKSLEEVNKGLLLNSCPLIY